MEKPDDLGLATLRHVRETLALEEKWTLDEPRGFSFWGCDRRQRVWAEETVVNRQGSGLDTCRLHAEVDLLGPGALTPKVREHAELLSETFPLSAIRLRADGRLMAHCAVEVRSGDDGMVDLFTQAVALQWACARSVVPGLSEAVGRAPDLSHHPKGRERTAPCRLDGWLRVVGDAGNRDSAWTAEEEKERTLARLLQFGFTCGHEVPAFPQMSFWVGIPFPRGNDEDPISPALVHVETDGEHPWLGRGAWVKLWLPPHAGRANVGLDALALGDFEARQDVYSDLLGSWRWAQGDAGSPSRTLVQAVFLPNQLFRPGRLLEVVQGTVWRADVLARFYAGAPPRNMNGSWRPEEQGPTLVGDVRLLVREQRAGWRAQLSDRLEQAARGGEHGPGHPRVAGGRTGRDGAEARAGAGALRAGGGARVRAGRVQRGLHARHHAGPEFAVARRSHAALRCSHGRAGRAGGARVGEPLGAVQRAVAGRVREDLKGCP